MASVVAFDKVHFYWRPNDAFVEPRFPSSGVRAPTSSQTPIDEVELRWHEFPAVSNVGLARVRHPGDKVTARRAAALGAEQRIVTPEEGTRSVHAVPGVAYRYVNGFLLVVVVEDRQRARS